MMILFRRALAAAFLLFVAALPAHAQFANQATYAGNASGPGSAQAITLPNMVTLSDILGVPITWVPSATNTGAVTLAINSGTATAIQKPSGSGLVALTNAEMQTGQPVMTFYNGTVHILISLNGAPNTAVTPNYLATSALAFTAPYNLQCSASVGSNALTISVLTAGGLTPSATSPVLVPLRDVTLANGDPVVISVTGALSITVPQSATLGTVSNQANRIWVGLFNNGGTPVLGVYNSLNSAAPSVVPWDETALVTSTNITAGSTSSQVWYTVGAVTAKSWVPICHVESTQTTAGTWATTPSRVQLFGPGVKRPGDVVQKITATTTTAPTVSSTTYAVFTGQNATITPVSAANLIYVRVSGSMTLSGGNDAVIQLSRGTVANTNIFGSQAANTSAANQGVPAVVEGYDQPNTVSATTYAVQGKSNSGTVSFSRTSGTYTVTTAQYTLEEIQI
jgi:hypothetical protein